MASLPTAYASQRFGRRTLNYTAIDGEIADADPRARCEERRLMDGDGDHHLVRLMERDFRLEAGDAATILRVQAGPAHRSHAVAVINHDTGGWRRTHPDAAGLLARAGVSRSASWILTMAAFALTALMLVWPLLRAFLMEVDPTAFSAAPAFNLGELIAAYAPMLASWRFSEIAAPLTAQITGIAPGLEAAAPALLFNGAVLVAALGAYLLRDWRLVWAPLFILALLAGAVGFGGAAGMTAPALTGLALASGVFLIGGLINRIRDAARLDRRIAVLADEMLRQDPRDQGEAQRYGDAASPAPVEETRKPETGASKAESLILAEASKSEAPRTAESEPA